MVKSNVIRILLKGEQLYKHYLTDINKPQLLVSNITIAQEAQYIVKYYTYFTYYLNQYPWVDEQFLQGNNKE